MYLFSVTDSSSKRPRLDQIPAANLDADDPGDDEDDDDVRYIQTTNSVNILWIVKLH